MREKKQLKGLKKGRGEGEREFRTRVRKPEGRKLIKGKISQGKKKETLNGGKEASLIDWNIPKTEISCDRCQCTKKGTCCKKGKTSAITAWSERSRPGEESERTKQNGVGGKKKIERLSSETVQSIDNMD